MNQSIIFEIWKIIPVQTRVQSWCVMSQGGVALQPMACRHGQYMFVRGLRYPDGPQGPVYPSHR